MTRDELHDLIRTALVDPKQFAPGEPDGDEDPPEVWEIVPLRQATRAVLTALRSPDDEPHILDVQDEGWSLAHPLQCRLDDLFRCEVHKAAEWLSEPPAEPGRYEVTVTPDDLVIGKAVE